MSNWFLAVPVSAAGWFPDRVGEPPPGVRLFHPDDLHVTVVFLGACGGEAAGRAWADARAFPGPRGPATLDRIVPMGNPRRPSALSALLGEGCEEATAFLAAHRDRWADLAGAPRDRRPPLPHCTVARPRRAATGAERARAARWAEGLEVRGVAVTLGALALYTWSEDRSARLFRVVARAGEDS
jgi:2'-5' RNA ligase